MRVIGGPTLSRKRSGDSGSPMPLRVFISHARKDARLKDALIEQLSVLERFHGVKFWTADSIPAGSKWREEINKELARCDVALMLVSSSFMGSDFINQRELPALLKRQAKGGLVIIPVILSDCAWQHHPAIYPFQALPKGGVPITNYSGNRRASALKQVAEAIAALAKRRPRGKMKRPKARAKTEHIQLTLPGEVSNLPQTKLAVENARLSLAHNLGIEPDEIKVKRVERGSIKITLEVPKGTAARAVREFQKPGSPLHKDLGAIGVVEVRPVRASSFGSEVRRRREALRMSLEQLAEASRLTPNYIGTIESSKRDPSLSTVLSLARGLRVHPAELFGGVEGLSPAAVEAGLLFDAVPPEIQGAVLQILRSVSREKMGRLVAEKEDHRDAVEELKIA